MNAATSVGELLAHLEGAAAVDGDTLTVSNEAALIDKIDFLVYSAVFSEGLTRDTARWLIWELGQAVGVYPASIHELYLAIGRGDLPANFTVPAMNVRAINYEMSRAIFRAAIKHHVGAMIFEIARSEMGYTDQRPAEYSACVIAAALKEGFRGPIFIQGDHFQLSASRYAQEAKAELQAVKDLIQEAVEGGFYNIDIDTSTLVDLSHKTLDAQQKLNYAECAALTKHARALEPDGITISLGGEIGEVGHKNSTVEELRAFMDGYLNSLPAGIAGISKISVQTGTSHGGVVMPDGSLADVNVDFGTLQQLGKAARDEYHTGGAVQHGASTLPADAFNNFPLVGTLEIHLATNFQNIIFDHAPQSFVDAAYNHIKTHNAHEKKEGETEDQFIYKTRKKGIGPLKKMMWDFAPAEMGKISGILQEQFEFLFKQLGVYNTDVMSRNVTTPVAVHRPRPQAATVEAALDIADDLAD